MFVTEPAKEPQLQNAAPNKPRRGNYKKQMHQALIEAIAQDKRAGTNHSRVEKYKYEIAELRYDEDDENARPAHAFQMLEGDWVTLKKKSNTTEPWKDCVSIERKDDYLAEKFSCADWYPKHLELLTEAQVLKAFKTYMVNSSTLDGGIIQKWLDESHPVLPQPPPLALGTMVVRQADRGVAALPQMYPSGFAIPQFQQFQPGSIGANCTIHFDSYTGNPPKEPDNSQSDQSVTKEYLKDQFDGLKQAANKVASTLKKTQASLTRTHWRSQH